LPILIDGNSNFNALNGVTSGNGNAGNPWIIEGWFIVATWTQSAIEIEHTTDYFVIRNIQTLSDSNIGIYLLDSSHGSVLNSTLVGGGISFSGGWVLRIEQSPDIIISRNKIVNGTIYVSDGAQGPLSANLAIANNTLVNSTISITSCAWACIQNPPMMKILGNALVDEEPPCTDPHNLCPQPCAICESAIGTTIADNTVSGYFRGIEVGGSDSTVKDNLLQTTGDDIVLNTVNSTTVSGNIMTGLGIAITGLYSSSYGLDRASYYDSHSIGANNLVNGNPVLYYAHCASVSLANVEISQLIIASCSNVDLVNVRTVGKVDAGVFMAYVKHAKLSQDHFDGNAIALGVVKSSDVNVSYSEISNNRGAIFVSFSTGFALERSTVSMNNAALFVESSTNTTISDNLFASNNNWGIRLSDATSAVVSRNRLQNSYGLDLGNVANAVIQGNQISDSRSDGLTLDSVVNVRVEGNWISNSSRYGIAVSAANGLNITANTVIYNAVGILLGSSLNGPAIYNTIVYHNNFVYNTRDQGEYYSGVVLKMDNGYPSGGNYWSDYTGVDKCSGVNQDVCPQPDGIGDTPYIQLLTMCYPTCYGNPRPPVAH